MTNKCKWCEFRSVLGCIKRKMDQRMKINCILACFQIEKEKNERTKNKEVANESCRKSFASFKHFKWISRVSPLTSSVVPISLMNEKRRKLIVFLHSSIA